MTTKQQLEEVFNRLALENKINIKSRVFLKTYEIAQILDVSLKHTAWLIKNKKIKGYKTTPGETGRYRVLVKDLRDYFVSINLTEELKSTID